jgi:membrane fusion protein, multidrug efflux system
MSLPISTRATIVTACLLLAFAAGCSKEEAKAPPQRPPVDVTVVTVTARDTPVTFEFVGQTQSSREVEIRARIDGFLEKRLYVEGDLVRAGQPLFQVDRKPFAASLQTAKGQLAEQQASLDVAVANLARVKPLAEQNAVSKKDLDDAVGNEQRARAAVLQAQGQVQTAELSLGYTTINSPLTGLSSFAKLQEGTYLSASNNLLTYVAQLDPIWVNFSISENETLRYRDEAARNLLRLPKDNNFEIEVVLADGTVYPNRGHISFADPSFSKDTGTFLVRSVLGNPSGQLRPGQFVTVNVLGATRPNSILVPQRAVQQGAKSHFVWVVGKDGKAEQRVVDVGTWHGDDWFVNSGLKSGEQVVVDGAIRVGPAATLKATPYAPASAPAKASAAAAPPMSYEQEQASGKAAPNSAAAASANVPTKVYFDRDSDALTAEGSAALSPLTGLLAAQRALQVDVTGFTDKTGADSRNVQLAKDRAKAVRAALVGQGVLPGQINLKAPATVVGAKDDREARRVEIAVGKAPAAPAKQ